MSENKFTEFGIINTHTKLCVNFGRVAGDCEAPSWHPKEHRLAGKFSKEEVDIFLNDLIRLGYSVEFFQW